MGSKKKKPLKAKVRLPMMHPNQRHKTAKDYKRKKKIDTKEMEDTDDQACEVR